jgi:hypothetical protein
MSHGRVGERYVWNGVWEGIEVSLTIVVEDGRSEVRRVVLESGSEVTRRRLRDLPLGELREKALAHLRRFEGLYDVTRAGAVAHRLVAGSDAPRTRPRMYGQEHYDKVLAMYDETGTVTALARLLDVSRPTASRWLARARRPPQTPER